MRLCEIFPEFRFPQQTNPLIRKIGTIGNSTSSVFLGKILKNFGNPGEIAVLRLDITLDRSVVEDVDTLRPNSIPKRYSPTCVWELLQCQIVWDRSG